MHLTSGVPIILTSLVVPDSQLNLEPVQETIGSHHTNFSGRSRLTSTPKTVRAIKVPIILTSLVVPDSVMVTNLQIREVMFPSY